MHPTYVLVPATILAVLSAALSAQSFPAPEARALELKAAARYPESQRAFAALLDSTADDPLAAARAEFHATQAHTLAARLGKLGFRRDLRAFVGGTTAARHPFLRDHCRHLALDLAQQAGDHTMAAELTRELGYIGVWQLIGPFDNERGSGWARAFGPEDGFDLDATYDGKKRAVRWRPCPVTDPSGGVVDLGAMLRPNKQVLCYAAVVLHADRDGPAALHLGSDEAAKVFLNGTELWGRDVRRRIAPDQDAVRLPLRAGPNLLMLKICEQEGAFRFAARLRDIDGRPLDHLRTSIDQHELAAAAAQPGVAIENTAPLERGARTTLQRSIDATADPFDAIRLSMLLGLNHADDPAERRDHELAKLAFEALPNSATARYLLAFTRVREGAAETRDENPRRRDYEQILVEHPDHVEAMRSLAELELDTTGIATRALQLLDRALEITPTFAAARLTRARALERLHLSDAAEAEFEPAAAPNADGDRSPPAVAECLRRAIGQRDWSAARALAPARLATSYDAASTTQVADLFAQLGDRDGAVRTLEHAIAHLPFAREPRHQLAQLFEVEGDYDRALGALSDWLTICPEDDATLVRIARLHALRRDVEQQREVLATAIELNPNLKAERRLLEFLQTDEVPFYQPFVIEVADAAGDTAVIPADVATANNPYYYLLRHDVVRAYRNGTTSRYHHEIVRVLNDQGARDLTAFYVPHFWGEQRARLLQVRVIRADGTELRPRLSGSYVRFPPLAAGDTCDVRYRVDDLAPTFFGDYFGLEHTFTADDGSPVRRSVLDLILDPGRDYRLQTRNGTPDAVTQHTPDGAATHHFELRDLARRKLEELRPDRTETEPLVRVTTYRDWNHFSSWWWNLIRKQSEVTPEMVAKSRELTDSLPNESAKIDALYRFVTTEIRYKAWEFGVHGYKPYTTSVIFERRHGDCKDKALLLNAMLGIAGIQAFPVLIHADPHRSADDLSLPMVQHFNHCISYLPATADRPERYLDGTATYHPADTLPDMDQGARVLVVEGDTGAVRGIDWIEAAENIDARAFDVQLEPTGAAVVTMTHTPTRNQAVWVRDALGNEPAKRAELLERQLAGAFGRVEILSVETSNLLDLGDPVRVVVKFRCPEFATTERGALVLRPSLMPRSLQTLTSAQQRDFALLLGIPATDSQRVRYRLPAGFEPLDIPPPTQLDARFGSFRSVWTVRDGELAAERQQAFTTERIEAVEYPEFREFAAEVDRADLGVVLVKRRNS